ncbi:MAG TPA: beta-ketoacyl-[acyl-carrier-protein] synthase family protein, partial [Psychromonas sp.]
VYIHATAVNCALGETLKICQTQLAQNSTANMCLESGWLNDGSKTVVGKIATYLPAIEGALAHYNTRNNRIALSALVQIKPEIEKVIQRYGAERVAVIVATSTSGISDGELALAAKLKSGKFPEGYTYEQQEISNLGEFTADYFKLNGPVYTISTACSSSGRVFISAKRLLKAGLVDAVLVGGADSLCKLTLNGFHGLAALSDEICNPFSENRKGINIGEAGAFMLLARDKNSTGLALLGAGDSSDAFHLSAPHPEGEGAIEAIRKALDDAHLSAREIGYINAHGTATKLNDEVEAQAIYSVFGDTVPVSSTKPFTGHTLGTASILEAVISCLVLEQNMDLPIQINDGEIDKNIKPIKLIEEKQKPKVKTILSNSFAFGGNNISLIFGYAND